MAIIGLGRRFSIGLICLLLVQIGSAATIELESAYDRIDIKGEIRPGDEKQLERLIRQVRRGQYTAPRVMLDSPGGDIETAIKMGRVIRQHEVGTVALASHGSMCSSACVLILLGGVSRDTIGDRLGIHRFYFGALPRGLSTAEVKERYLKGRSMIAAYLDEMNVPKSLLDAMESIPPGEMRFLNEQEARYLGITGSDPIYEERDIARKAAEYGIASAEFRRREAEAQSKCVSLKKGDEERFANCRSAVLWGVSPTELSRRWDRARGELQRFNTAETRRACMIKILGEGRLAC